MPPAALPAANEAPEGAPVVRDLRFDWTRDTVITGVGAVFMLSTEALWKKQLTPEKCRWCDRNPDGTEGLNGVDRWGRGIMGSTDAQRKRARTWSNIVDIGLLPASALGAQYALSQANGAPRSVFVQDVAIITETAVLASVLNQTVKFIAGRERPFVHVLPEDQKPLTEKPDDNNLSFYSGHTSMAFSVVVSAGMVAELRGYKHRAWIWAVGLPLATTVPLLRMAAGKHYLTDVATGAVLGSAFGVAVPLLLHGRMSEAPGPASLQLSGGPRGAVVSGRF